MLVFLCSGVIILKEHTIFNKIIYCLIAVLLLACGSAEAKERKAGVKGYIVIGIIKSIDPQGNSYMELIIADEITKNDVKVWCVLKKASIYSVKDKVSWAEIKEGQRAGIRGKWITEEGQRKVNAERLDLL